MIWLIGRQSILIIHKTKFKLLTKIMKRKHTFTKTYTDI